MIAIYVVLLISVLTTVVLMAGVGGGLQLACGGVLLGSLAYLTMRVIGAEHERQELAKLRATYAQLDQQAKWIIRADLELHHAQEELDRRLASLMSLHQLGRQLQVSLKPEEVFQKFDAAIVTNFGFSVGLFGVCPTMGAVAWQSLVGVTPEAAERLRVHVTASGLLKQLLADPTPRLWQAGGGLNAAQRALLDLLGSSSAVVASILPHSGPAGCFILCRPGVRVSTSKADEELVKILAHQLSTAVENSALYEHAWSEQQTLERKVQERTRELAEANAALTRMNKAKSDFVSAVSHELRTPLAAIKGYASLLNSGQFGTLAQPQAERLAKIEKHADLLTQFITNLLDIARIEAGRTTMERRAIPVQEFLATIQELVQPQLLAKRLQLAIDRDGVTELLGDAQHLQRVLVNLLSNAVKYTPESGRISVGLRRDGASVVVTVSDSGCGIPAEDLPKLFQEFYRANDPVNQQIRGTGLGLALVKRIVEAHRGTITVASQRGQGTTFTVMLPAAAEPPAP